MTLHPLPAVLAAAQLGGAAPLGLTHSWIGMLALLIFAAAYLLVVNEEGLQLQKSKPVVLAAGLIWVLIAIGFQAEGQGAAAAAALRENLLDYIELFLFILSAMTFVNTMEERQVFDAMRASLVRRGLTLRSLFWATGLLAFFISAWL
ncbi:MAG TPA: sodium:proton antiporter NhaD, partial [Longimicrobiales bacterium]